MGLHHITFATLTAGDHGKRERERPENGKERLIANLSCISFLVDPGTTFVAVLPLGKSTRTRERIYETESERLIAVFQRLIPNHPFAVSRTFLL